MGNVAAAPETRVLVADDEENQRAGLAKMIQSWGFAVETAADGQEAFEKLGQIPVHVLVSDLMMPRMDGFELLKRLGAQGNMPPTIVLTAFGNIETAVQTMHDLGAFWFLEKPIQPSALKVLLERAATQSRLPEETGRTGRHRRLLLGHATGLLDDPAGVAVQGAGFGDRRKRYRQGTGSARRTSS